MQLIKKITLGGINNVRGGFKTPQDGQFIARVIGVLREVETIETAYGAAKRFRGEFRATNADGEEFASPVLFLPEPAQSILSEAIAGNVSVQFAFDVSLKLNSNSPLGYEYSVKPLINSAPSDPLASIMAQIAPPALPDNSVAGESGTTKKKSAK